jgi:hypothetical protein
MRRSRMRRSRIGLSHRLFLPPINRSGTILQHLPKALPGKTLGSEVDLVDSSHVILKVHHVVENQPLSLADRVVADDSLLC